LGLPESPLHTLVGLISDILGFKVFKRHSKQKNGLLIDDIQQDTGIYISSGKALKKLLVYTRILAIGKTSSAFVFKNFPICYERRCKGDRYVRGQGVFLKVKKRLPGSICCSDLFVCRFVFIQMGDWLGRQIGGLIRENATRLSEANRTVNRSWRSIV
jgi:hypothetical protein